MVPRRRYLLILLAVMVVTVVVGGLIILGDPPRASNEKEIPKFGIERISFLGNISSDDGLTVDGTLHHTSHTAEFARGFDNVSIQLYAANGTLLSAECLGDMAYWGEISVHIETMRTPKYVIFHTPEIWTLRDSITADVAYYVRKGEYLSYPATKPSEYPVNVTGRPCRG